MLKKTILLLLALYICIAGHTQTSCTSSLSGQVTDDNDAPLVGAVILLTPGNIGQTTDGEGRYALNNLCPGTFRIKVQYLGYKEVTTRLQVSGNSKMDFRLEEEITELKELVIQDHHADTEHATNYTELGERKLAENAGRSLGETLREVPGVNTIQTGPGIFKPVIHGVHSQRVLILNYGIRQEGQQWGAEHAPEIDPFVASNIVVIKDASSIKYGTDALGGVILVNPPPLPEKSGLGGSIQTILQSNGRSGILSGMLEGGIKEHDGWGWRVQGTAKRTGDFRSPDYSLTNTGIKELNFSTAVGYHREHFGIDVFFSHFQTELGILKGTSVGNLNDLEAAMEREPPLYTTDFSYTIGEPRQEVSHNLLKINGHIRKANREWRFQYGFQNNDRREYDLRIGDLSRIPAIDLRLNTHTLEAEWEKTSEKRSTYIGITGIIQDNDNIHGTNRIPFIPDFNNLSGGLFAIQKFSSKNLTVDIGARYDYRHYTVAGYDYLNRLYHSTLRFHNASATAGSILKLRKNQQLSLNLSSAWRPPHVAELYSLGTHQSAAAIEYGLLLNDPTNEVMTIDDVSFKVEQALKAVSTYQRSWKSFQVEATAYVNYIFNYMYLRPSGVTKTIRGTFPYFRYTQTNARFLGADLSAAWNLNSYWTITPRTTLLWASDETNHDYLVFIPSNRYEIGIRYESLDRFKHKNFVVETRLNFTDRQHRAPRTITVREFNEALENDTDPLQGSTASFDFMDTPDAYWLWNVAVGMSIRSEKVKYDFRLASDNMLNTAYREYTNRLRYYADDAGRNFLISFKCTF